MARNLIPPGLILLVCWAQETLDQLIFAGSWNLPLSKENGIVGLFTFSFSHSGFNHLFVNTLVFIPLSILVQLRGGNQFNKIFIYTILFHAPLFFLSSNSIHGLSGVCYALLGYLLALGFVKRNFLTVIISCLTFSIYGYQIINLIGIKFII